MIRTAKRIMLSCLLSGALFSGIAHAQLVQWNVQASNTSFPQETVSGYFDYDASSNTVTNWNLTATGLASNNTGFRPPSRQTFSACGANCSVFADNFNYPGQTDLVFTNSFTSNAGAALAQVSLLIPTTAFTSSAQSASIVPGYPQSFWDVRTSTDSFYTAGEYTTGVIQAGAVSSITTNGNPAYPDPTILPDAPYGIKSILGVVGSDPGSSAWYGLATTGPNNRVTASLQGATTGTYELFLFNLNKGVPNPANLPPLGIATLDSSNNFTASIGFDVDNGYQDFEIGIVNEGPGGDPDMTLSFDNPVYSTNSPSPAPIPGTAGLLVSALAGLGLVRCRPKAARKKAEAQKASGAAPSL